MNDFHLTFLAVYVWIYTGVGKSTFAVVCMEKTHAGCGHYNSFTNSKESHGDTRHLLLLAPACIRINTYVCAAVLTQYLTLCLLFHTSLKHTGLHEDNQITTYSNSDYHFTKNGFEFIVVIIMPHSIIGLTITRPDMKG